MQSETPSQGGDRSKITLYENEKTRDSFEAFRR